MGLQTSFDVLSDVIEQYESSGRSVRNVEATTGAVGDVLEVTMDVPVSICPASDGAGSPDVTPEAASLAEDGGLVVEFSTPGLGVFSATGAAVSAEQRGVQVADDGLRATVSLTVDPAGDERAPSASPGSADRGDGGLGAEPDAAASLAAVRDDSVPPYEDTRYLERLYETCETFAEMSREIEMDVSSETVRRYMIEAGVHDPDSYGTGASDGGSGPDSPATDEAEPGAGGGGGDGDGDDPAADPIETIASEQLVADGIGLPGDLAIEDVADAVVDAMTIHEVHRRLGIGRECTRDLLKQLNLIDLVSRRVGDNPERSVTYEEVASRIRQCTPEEGGVSCA